MIRHIWKPIKIAGCNRIPSEWATASTKAIYKYRAMAIKKKAYRPTSWATWPISSIA